MPCWESVSGRCEQNPAKDPPRRIPTNTEYAHVTVVEHGNARILGDRSGSWRLEFEVDFVRDCLFCFRPTSVISPLRRKS